MGEQERFAIVPVVATPLHPVRILEDRPGTLMYIWNKRVRRYNGGVGR